jgi:hypothetical protein
MRIRDACLNGGSCTEKKHLVHSFVPLVAGAYPEVL